MISAIRWAAAIAILMGVRPASGQHVGAPLFRLEAGTLTPGDPTVTTLAIGASAGWQVRSRTTILLRYLRQSQNRNSGEDVGRLARGFLTVNWEYALGNEGQYQRQAMVRFGPGIVIRPSLPDAAVLGGAFELRYGLTPRWALIGSIEDDLAFLPGADFQFCAGCPVEHFKGKAQHNLGFIVAGEWRR